MSELSKIDNIFCDDKPMTDCPQHKAFDGLRSFFGIDTEDDLTNQQAKQFTSFTKKTGGGFQENFAAWKARFPFHSFIGKPSGWTADSANSPRSKERFVLCFGKRVASELHRRPNGAHILTDQNNIGCHGWYDAAGTSAQLKRMVDLWKPPTCQLAEMTYVMKKEIMAKFQQMNERLFDSLPSMLNDEMGAEDEEPDLYSWESKIPKPFAPGEITTGSQVLVDGMRVVAKHDLCLTLKDSKWVASPQSSDARRELCGDNKRLREGNYGVVRIDNGLLQVAWDSTTDIHQVEGDNIKVLPASWKRHKNWRSHVSDLVAGVNKISDQAKHLFESFFATKQHNLANLMSGSVSKWVVCPVKNGVSDEELDSQLGVEDEAFKDFQMEAYKHWTGFEAGIPGEKCELKPSEILADGSGFSSLAGCDINELHADHVEKYTNEDGHTEQFICPLRPALVPAEQLEILREKKGTCYLHMTSKQRQQYVWHYQGEFPARRQNDRKENIPKTEFELVKLLKTPKEGITSEVNYGRFCSLAEFNAQPRFCRLPKVYNEWSTLNAYAESLAASLKAVIGTDEGYEVAAPLGIGATAVSESVSEYKDKLTTSDKVQENAKKAAVWVGENTWDSLRGTGRLLKSTAKYATNKLLSELKGAGRVAKELEASLFGDEKAGDMLHALSYQRSIGKSDTTSNSRERYQRYVMEMPCGDFDPAKEFALKKRWSNIALRMVKEAHLAHKWRPEGSRVLDLPSVSLELRGEAAAYRMTHNQAKDSVTNQAWASMRWGAAKQAKIPECEKVDDGCSPAHVCKKSGMFGYSCKDASWKWSVAVGKWWPVENDADLQSLVSPAMTSGLFDIASSLSGLKMDLFCAPKKDFGATGAPRLNSDQSLESCLRQGVLTNARLHAKEPWKLYFPEEVVVMARFSEIDSASYSLEADVKPDDAKVISQGATKDVSTFRHLLNKDGVPYNGHASSSNKFLGFRSGKGFPASTLEEVVLAPQDVLEALAMIENSFGR